MRSPVLRFLTTFFLLALVYGGIRWHQSAISGHWHMVRHTENAFNGMATFDVDDFYDEYEDRWVEVIRINDYEVKGSWWGGRINRWSRSSVIYPSCFNMHLTYRRVGDSLYLTETDYDGVLTGETAVAFRCGEACCDPQADLFRVSGLQIDLPVRAEGDSLDTIAYSAAGPLLLMIGKTSAGEWKTRHYGRFLSKSDFPLMIEAHEIKLPERIRPQIVLRLYADRNTPTAVLEDVVQTVRALRPGMAVERVYRDAVLERPLGLYARRVKKGL